MVGYLNGAPELFLKKHNALCTLYVENTTKISNPWLHFTFPHLLFSIVIVLACSAAILSRSLPLIMVKYIMIVHVRYKYHQYACIKLYCFVFYFFQVPATREVLSSLPSVLSALCLNNRGLQAFMRCKPFDKLFRVLLSPDYLPAMRRRRTSETLGRPSSVLVVITMF